MSSSVLPSIQRVKGRNWECVLLFVFCFLFDFPVAAQINYKTQQAVVNCSFVGRSRIFVRDGRFLDPEFVCKYISTSVYLATV